MALASPHQFPEVLFQFTARLVCIGISALMSLSALRAQEPTPQLILPLGHSDAALAGKFSRSGRLIITGAADQTAILWQASTGREIRRLLLDGKIISASISADDRYVLVTNDNGRLGQFDAATGKGLRLGFCLSAVFLDDNEILCAAPEGGIGLVPADIDFGRIIDPEQESAGRFVGSGRSFVGKDAGRARLIVVPRQTTFLLAAFEDGSLARYDIPSGALRWKRSDFCAGSLTTGLGTIHISVADIIEGKQPRQRQSPSVSQPSLSSIAVSGDGSTVAAACNNAISVLDGIDGHTRKTWGEKALYVAGLDLSFDGSRIASAQMGLTERTAKKRLNCLEDPSG